MGTWMVIKKTAYELAISSGILRILTHGVPVSGRQGAFIHPLSAT